MLHMQLPLVNDDVAAEALRNAEARVMAIATVHQRLYKDRHIGSIAFDTFLRDLCGNIARAYGNSDAIQVDAQPIVVDRDQAYRSLLIVNELVTNVFRHAELPCQVRLWDEGNHSFRLRVSDTGKGPATGARSTGLGTRMIAALLTQFNGSLETKADDEGYHCEIFVPHLRAGAMPAAVRSFDE